MIDCAFIIYALDDAFFYSKGRRDVRGDMRMDAIGAVVPCGFGVWCFVCYDNIWIKWHKLLKSSLL